MALVDLALFAFLCGVIDALSQNGISDTKGSKFTLAFFPESSTAPSARSRNYLYVASPYTGTCTANYYDDDSRKTSHIVLNPNNVSEKALADSTQVTNIGTGVESKAIYVSCDFDVSLYGYNKRSSMGDVSESFVVLPDTMLSTDYLVPSVNKEAFIGVVSVSNSTRLSIQLKSTCEYQYNLQSYRSGDAINVTLSHNDVFRLGGTKDSIADMCDLGGTVIQSSRPVAVFTGALTYRDPSFNNGHLVFQVPPGSAFSHIIVVPSVSYRQAKKMFVRVLASQHNTLVNIISESSLGGVQTTAYHINVGEFIENEFSSEINVIVRSNTPVLVTQRTVGLHNGGSLMFIPGINQYEKSALVRSFKLDGVSQVTLVTVITYTGSTGGLSVNGNYPQDLVWTSLNSVPYSVGSFSIQRSLVYKIINSSPMLVRLTDTHDLESYSYIAGYLLQKPVNVEAAVNLKCLSSGWDITLELNKLYLEPSDVSNVYLYNDNCTGTLQENHLLFNKTYQDCQTNSSVSNGTITYTNTLVYTQSLPGPLARNVIWRHDVKCFMPVAAGNVHHNPDHTNPVHSESSGIIEQPFHISLYRDAAYQNRIVGSVLEINIGQAVYVHVASDNQDTVMVVQSCDAHLEDDKHVSYPLIENGCSTGTRTKILVSRNQLTRFRFEMFDIQKEQNGIYVTCHVTFCDPLNFESRCQQRCHIDPHVGLVG